ADRLLASHEQRNNHVREDHDVAQRQNGIDVERSGGDGFALTGHGCPSGRPAREPTLKFVLTTPADEPGPEIQQLMLVAYAPRPSDSPNRIAPPPAARFVPRTGIAPLSLKMGFKRDSFKPPERRISPPVRRARRRCRADAPCLRPPKGRSRPVRPHRARAVR